MDITGIDLFYQNAGKVGKQVRLRYSLHEYHDIDLFDQNAGMKCANVRLRYLWISLVLIYFIKMWVWHLLKLESHVHGYHQY